MRRAVVIVWGRDAFSHYDPFLFKKERKYFMKTRKKLLCMFAALMLSMFMFMNVGAVAVDVADEQRLLLMKLQRL